MSESSASVFVDAERTPPPADTALAVHEFPMLLMESETLLRRTVSLTARTLGLGRVNEASSQAMAMQLLNEQSFRGLVIALDFGHRQYESYDFTLIDQVRAGDTASDQNIPIAVLMSRCDTLLLEALRERDVTRIILKPFRARVLLDTFAEIQALHGI